MLTAPIPCHLLPCTPHVVFFVYLYVSFCNVIASSWKKRYNLTVVIAPWSADAKHPGMKPMHVKT